MIQLVRPHDGPVTQWYGNIQPDGLPHAGQDYGYTDGVKVYPNVYAAAPGEVIWAGDSRNLGWPNEFYVNPDFDRSDAQDTSAGNLIVIDHGDFVTGYAHLESFRVKAGDTVKTRQHIAITGNTGYSFGRHLHFFLMLQPYHYATSTYGCSDPNPYFGGIAAQGTTTPQEVDELSAADVKEIKDYIHALLVKGYTSAGEQKPGIADIVTENQRRIGRVANQVWEAEFVHQGAHSARTELVRLHQKVIALTAAVGALSKNPNLTAEQITDAVKAGLAEAVVDVDVNINGKEAV
ncbi:lysin A [Arthrobacter phage Elesar]|uniref:Lysin A n=1 Tax=Arthrobacter phage Elesar TaxID=2510522 RepID=A0A411CQK1_9CAUD|nr:lysin A [Arthrobacter phage Elesar]QAY16076.1 lysin A [Arthrobacter phage Elesar]